MIKKPKPSLSTAKFLLMWTGLYLTMGLVTVGLTILLSVGIYSQLTEGKPGFSPDWFPGGIFIAGTVLIAYFTGTIVFGLLSFKLIKYFSSGQKIIFILLSFMATPILFNAYNKINELRQMKTLRQCEQKAILYRNNLDINNFEMTEVDSNRNGVFDTVHVEFDINSNYENNLPAWIEVNLDTIGATYFEDYESAAESDNEITLQKGSTHIERNINFSGYSYGINRLKAEYFEVLIYSTKKKGRFGDDCSQTLVNKEFPAVIDFTRYEN